VRHLRTSVNRGTRVVVALGSGSGMVIAAKNNDVAATEISFAEELLWQGEVDPSKALPFLDCSRNLSVVLRIEGPLNVQALRISLDAIVQRHDVLRSGFAMHGGQLARLPARASVPDFTMMDLGATTQIDPSEIVETVIKPQLERPFELGSGPLVRAIVIALGSQEHILAIALHHIVFDRWSRRLLELELRDFYNACSTGRAMDASPLPARYGDYVLQQREQLNTTRSRKLVEYWTNRLHRLPDVTLPSGRDPGRNVILRSGTLGFRIAADQVNRLAALSRRFRTTLATTMLAILKLFVYRVAGADDIAVGVPLSDRRRREFENLIGLFMNVVVVRTSLTLNMSFLELLERVRHALVDACLRQDLPYGYLMQTMGIRRPYRVIFNFMPSLPPLDLDLAGTRTKHLPVDMQPPHLLADLSLQVGSDSGALWCRLVYKTERFSTSCMKAFAAQIETLIHAVLNDPDRSIDTYPLESPILS
jgi:hypothetical protein